MPSASPKLDKRTVSVDGADLSVWHRPGDGNRWMLWLHGAGGAARSFDRQFDAFDGVDLLFPDLRGHGASPLHDGRRFRFADAVDDVVRVLDAFGVDRAVVVGHSWGGNPAQEFSYRSPERTQALVMVGAWGQLRPMSSGELRRIRIMSRLYRFVPWSLVARTNARACSNVPETRSEVAAMLRDTGREVFIDMGLSAYEAVRDVDAFPQTPTLLVRGERDFPRLLGPVYERILERNARAVEVVLPGTGHMPTTDVPEAFNRAVSDFADTVWSVPPASR